MTVDRAHELYKAAVREGSSSRAKRPNKPRTVADKIEIHERDIRPTLGSTIIYDVTEADLVRLVTATGERLETAGFNVASAGQQPLKI